MLSMASLGRNPKIFVPGRKDIVLMAIPTGLYLEDRRYNRRYNWSSGADSSADLNEYDQCIGHLTDSRSATIIAGQLN